MTDVLSIVLLTILLVIIAIGILSIVFANQKKQLQYLSEKEQLQASFEKEILHSKLQIQEQTLKHVSQEVHDNIGQVLSVVKMNLNLMHSEDAALQESIKDTTELVGQAIQDLRNLSKSLHSDMVSERGLVKAIEYEFAMLKKRGAYTTSLVVEGEPYLLPEQKELILFRIFQEALNNTIKHAKATLIEVEVCFYPHLFLLCIRDNGQGFDSLHVDTQNGLGIRNIINRCELIGAFYHIDSHEGEGTVLKIELPAADRS